MKILNEQQDTGAESMFQRSLAFVAWNVMEIYLAREPSLLYLVFCQKSPPIGLEVQIPDLFERSGPAENFQDLMKKYLYLPLHRAFPCGHLIRQYPLIFLKEEVPRDQGFVPKDETRWLWPGQDLNPDHSIQSSAR